MTKTKTTSGAEGAKAICAGVERLERGILGRAVATGVRFEWELKRPAFLDRDDPSEGELLLIVLAGLRARDMVYVERRRDAWVLTHQHMNPMGPRPKTLLRDAGLEVKQLLLDEAAAFVRAYMEHSERAVQLREAQVRDVTMKVNEALAILGELPPQVPKVTKRRAFVMPVEPVPDDKWRGV